MDLIKDFNVRSYQPGDEDSIVDLLKLAFPEWARREAALDHWKWKYLDSPLGTDIVVAESEGKIIGVSHNMRLKLKMGRSAVFAQYSCDTTTHQDYRRFGVFRRLIEEVEKIRLEKKVKLGYGISGNPAIIHEWGKRGRIPLPHHIAYMHRIRDIGLHLRMRPTKKAALLSAGFKTLDNLNKIRRVFKRRTKSNNDFELVEIERFTDNADVFWAEIQKHYSFMTDKSSKFLNWRYCDPRAGRFIVKQAIKHGEVLGYIVHELRKDGRYPEGFIDDLSALPARLDVVHALLRDSCNYFDGLNVNAVHYMVVRGHPYQAISVNNAFLDSRRTPYITCQIIDAERDFEVLKVSSPGQIHFTHGDTL